MPVQMSLGGASSASEAVGVPDDVFAIHALAVLFAHDSEECKNAGVSISALVAADPCLSATVGTVRTAYLISFGRHGVPLLNKTLTTRYSLDDAAITDRVQEISKQLLASVGVGA